MELVDQLPGHPFANGMITGVIVMLIVITIVLWDHYE